MIDYSEIRRAYGDLLPNYTLYADYGEVERAVRIKNDIKYPVCALFKLQPPTVTAISGMFIGIASANIEVICPPDMAEEVASALNNAAYALNGSYMTVGDTEDADIKYSVSFSAQTCTVSEKTDVGAWYGECVILYQTVSFVIVEDGVSSYDVELKIDGESVPILTLAETKTHTTSVYPDVNAVSHTASEQESYGIDFTAPYTNSRVSRIFRRAVNGRTGNRAHCVEIRKNGESDAYIMAISAATDSVQPPSNVGFNISLTEISPSIARFDGRWARYCFNGRVVTAAQLASNILMKIKYEGSAVVFWGDGESDVIIDLKAYMYHVYSDGITVHDITVFSYASGDREIKVGDNLYGKRLTLSLDKNDPLTQLYDDGKESFYYRTAESIYDDRVQTGVEVIFGSGNTGTVEGDEDYPDGLLCNGSAFYFRAFGDRVVSIHESIDMDEEPVSIIRDGRSFVCPLPDNITFINDTEKVKGISFYADYSEFDGEVLG